MLHVEGGDRKANWKGTSWGIHYQYRLDQCPRKNINVISRGTSGGGDSQSACKKYARGSWCRGKSKVATFQLVAGGTSGLLTFSQSDLQGVHHPNDDALVVTASITNYRVKRVLVDTSSSSDILFASTFDQLSIPRDWLHLVYAPFIKFNGLTTQLLGMIKLPILMGTLSLPDLDFFQLYSGRGAKCLQCHHWQTDLESNRIRVLHLPPSGQVPYA